MKDWNWNKIEGKGGIFEFEFVCSILTDSIFFEKILTDEEMKDFLNK
jgi:hypothetical protein